MWILFLPMVVVLFLALPLLLDDLVGWIRGE